MKKRATIFVLFIFFFAQFGKVAAFVWCYADNYRVSQSWNCDCEKKLSGSVNTEKNNHQEHTGLNAVHFAELFCEPVEENLSVETKFIFNKTIRYKEPLYSFFLHSIFRPPAQV